MTDWVIAGGIAALGIAAALAILAIRMRPGGSGSAFVSGDASGSTFVGNSSDAEHFVKGSADGAVFQGNQHRQRKIRISGRSVRKPSLDPGEPEF